MAQGEHEKAQDLLRAARQERQLREQRLAETRGLIDEFIAHQEERMLRHLRAPELEDAVVRAVTEGYLAGIARNRNRVEG
jgi:hypothetical protein